MIDMQKKPSLSLKRRCMGPHATSIETLVQRAETAMERVLREYPLFARTRLDDLRRAAETALADSHDAQSWKALRTGLRDLQTSSAMAASPWISRFAAGLQGELAQREASDRNLPQLAGLYFDAMQVAASDTAAQAELAELERKLEHAGRTLRQ